MAAGARTASSLRSLTTAARDGLTAGSVHIRVFPRPRNLAESREILKALEKYGEITMYKHLKVRTAIRFCDPNDMLSKLISSLLQYEPIAPAPNTILAIYQNPDSAQKLISASPLQLRLELIDTGWKYLGYEGYEDFVEESKAAGDGSTPRTQEEAPAAVETSKADGEPSTNNSSYQTSKSTATKSDPSQSPVGTQKWGSRGLSIEKPSPPSQPPPPPPSDSTQPPPPLSLSPFQSSFPRKDRHGRSISTKYREYKLEIRPSNMNHQAYISRQWYYGPFPVNRKTIMAADLKGRVHLDGILDCRVGQPEVPLRIRDRMKKRGAYEVFSIRDFFEKTRKEGRGD